MTKKLLFAFGIIALLSSSALAFAWWDNFDETQSETVLLGEGVRISVAEDTVGEGRLLVPEGTFYADPSFDATHTTSYTFSYVVTMENPIESGYSADLTIDLGNWSLSSPALDVIAYEIGIAGEPEPKAVDSALFIGGAFSELDESYTITVKLTLANAPAEGDAVTVYNALQAGFTFDVNFEVSVPE